MKTRRNTSRIYAKDRINLMLAEVSKQYSGQVMRKLIRNLKIVYL